MMLGCAFLMMSDAVSKWLSQTYPVGQIMCLRNVFVLIPILIVVWRSGRFGDLRIGNWGGQFMRGGLHVLSAALFVTSVSLLPLADVHAVGFAGPIFIAALSPLLLNERVGWRRWTAILVGFAGVLVMLRPSGAGFHYLGLIPVAAALSAALRDITTRHLSRNETSVSMLLFSSAMVIVGGLFTAPFGWQALTLESTALFALNGLVNGSAHFLIIESYRNAEAPVVAPFNYTILIWTVIFGYLIFGDLPGPWTLSGAAIIVMSGLYILRRERSADAPGDQARSRTGPG